MRPGPTFGGRRAQGKMGGSNKVVMAAARLFDTRGRCVEKKGPRALDEAVKNGASLKTVEAVVADIGVWGIGEVDVVVGDVEFRAQEDGGTGFCVRRFLGGILRGNRPGCPFHGG